MSNIVDKLTCAHVKQLTPYESARRLFALGDGQQKQTWLNANESPFTEQYNTDASRFNRYPDCQPESVIKPYARYAGVDAEQVLVTRGADEGIELLIRAFCEAGRDSVLICPPTYGMYAISAQTCNVNVEKAPLNDDFSLNIEQIKSFKDKVNLVFVCSPNNPTGTSVQPKDIEQLLVHFADSALVVVDEAYIEFDQQSVWPNQFAKYPNLVVLRTLSKAFGLAGLRCGFTLANSQVIQTLLKVIAPYPIPEPVAQIANQALSANGITRMQQHVSTLQQFIQQIKTALSIHQQISLVGNDKANFILFRCDDKDQLMRYLVDHNVFIRDQSKQLNLQQCLRVTVGDQTQNQSFIDLVNQFYQSQEHAV